MDDDQPLPEGLAVAAELAREHRIVYLTGRPARYADVTTRWLQAHGLPEGEVICRPDGDRRPAHVLKLAAVAELARHRRVAVCVDDNPKVLAALRAGGFAVFAADWAVGAVDLLAAQQSGAT
jgi:phosphoglycolate phosphatase-like HAD superfamily hydrolase